MVRIDVYKAGAWHEFFEDKDQWLGAGPSVPGLFPGLLMIVPAPEDRLRLAQALPEMETGAIFTIPELIGQYLKSLGKNGLISLHTLESILSSIIGESSTAYLKMEQYKQGYVKALTDFIYKFQSISPVDLQLAIESFKEGRLTFKEKDLIRIYDEYRKRLPNYGFDLQSGLAELAQNTNTEKIGHHLGINAQTRIIFLGFNVLTPLEEEFVLLVFKNATKVVFLLCEDDDAAEQAVRVQKSVTNFLKRAANSAVEHRIGSSKQNDFFISLANTVFQPKPDAWRPHTTLEPAGKLFMTKENNRFAEIVAIARRIKHLTAQGVSLREIRLVAPEYPLYSCLIQEVFPEYGIPFSLADGIPLLRFPLAAVILNLVSQSIQPNPFLIREKIFSSPYISFVMEINYPELVQYQEYTGVEFIPAETLGQFLNPDAAYRLNYDYIKNIREKAYRTVRPGRDLSPLAMIKKYLDDLDTASEAEKALSPWQARMSGDEFNEALLGIFRCFKLEENIKFSRSQTGIRITAICERDFAILKQVKEFLAELRSLLTPTSQATAEKFPLNELACVFSRLMNEGRLPAAENPPVVNAEVTVQPVAMGQYRRWNYTFLCGLVDGEFPGEEEFNFLQPKKDGLSLGHAYTSVDHARNRFYYLLRSTAKALYLSFPLSHNGRRLSPSPFLKEIENRFPAGTAETGELINTSGQLNPDHLYSRREKLLFIGQNVDHNYQAARPLLKELKNSDEESYKNILEILRFDGLAANTACLSEFDGVFRRSTPSLALLSKAIKEITFTPGVFERYAACPLRFFLDDLMQLKTEPDYHPDTSEAGRFIRFILNAYSEQACAAQGVRAEAASFLKELLTRHFDEQYQGAEDAFQVRLKNQLSAGLGRAEAGRPGLFQAFLEYEKNAPDFLRPYTGNLSGTVEIGDELAVQVEIDRVDLTGAADYLILFLYTTATTGDPGKILRGLRFDLALAVLLLMNYTAEKDLKIPVAGAGLYLVKSVKAMKRGGYFAISSIRAPRQNGTSEKRPIFSGQREGFIPDADFPQALEKIKEHLLRLYGLIQKGVFHPPLCYEAEQTCANCSFGRICRKDQLRLERLRVNLQNEVNVNIIKEII